MAYLMSVAFCLYICEKLDYFAIFSSNLCIQSPLLPLVETLGRCRLFKFLGFTCTLNKNSLIVHLSKMFCIVKLVCTMWSNYFIFLCHCNFLLLEDIFARKIQKKAKCIFTDDFGRFFYSTEPILYIHE